MHRLLISGLIGLFILAGCAAEGPGTGTSPQQTEEGEVNQPPPRKDDERTDEIDEADEQAGNLSEDVEELAIQLDVPWAVAKTGETIYLTERGGRLVTIENQTVTRHALHLTEDVYAEGEGGLLGLVLAPDFASTGEAYLYHTYRRDGSVLNRVIKVKNEGDVWSEQEELLTDIPGGTIHNGGRMKIGPDGLLYVTTGDAGDEALSQEKDSLAGKILRLELNGNVPSDNPFPESYVYSYGHRNPQGLAWDEDGTLYSAEHGPSGHDEINRIAPGNNYGWPLIIGDETASGMETPLFHSGTETWAPSGLIYHMGRLYFAGLRGEHIRAFDLETETSDIVFEGVGRIRDLYVDEDGTLLVVTSNRDGRGQPADEDDRLLRLTFNDG